MRKLNLVGQRFGRLTVLEENGRKYHCVAWLCKCDCGNYSTVAGYLLKNGSVKSCGCINVEIMSNLNKKGNKYDLSGDYGICYFNDNKGQFIFDKEDYEKIKDYCWYKGNRGYAIHDRINRKSILAHRLITDCPNGMVVDHINHDTLDNRKCNLRICTSADNAKNQKVNSRNTSGHKGVFYNKKLKKWQSYINLDKKRFNLGCFDNKEDAIKIRQMKEIELFGEFANII